MTSSNPNTSEQTPNTNGYLGNSTERVLNKLANIHLANKAILLRNRDQILQQGMAVTEAWHRLTIPGYVGIGDDEMMNLGDIHEEHHHHYPASQSSAQPIPQPTPTKSITKSILPWLLASTGIGGGLLGAGYLVSQALKDRPTIQQTNQIQPGQSKDSDTQYQLGLD